MDGRTQIITVEASLPGERLDTYLRARFPAVSRSAIQRLIEQGHIRVNGAATKPTHAPRYGEQIAVHFPEARPATARPEAIPVDVLFEDEHLLVINKAAGLVVHPAAGNEEHTLVNALLHHCAGRLSGIGGVARPGIVHRLDKDTSGCLVVAKDDATHGALSAQFAGRAVRKSYDAIVCGELTRASGDIRAAIARHTTHRKRMAVAEGGREAWTSWWVREVLHGATWVEAELHTGRTHQIRVHFQHIGHPLAGDATYGSRQTRQLTEATGYIPPRLLLHARRLEFQHPTTQSKLAFEAPLPADFEGALTRLRVGGH